MLITFLVAGLAAVSAVTTQLRCVDAAREAALAASRGESGDVAGQRSAPEGATVTVEVEGDTVRARVRATVPLLSRLAVSAEAVASMEPGTPDTAR